MISMSLAQRQAISRLVREGGVPLSIVDRPTDPNAHVDGAVDMCYDFNAITRQSWCAKIKRECAVRGSRVVYQRGMVVELSRLLL